MAKLVAELEQNTRVRDTATESVNLYLFYVLYNNIAVVVINGGRRGAQEVV